MSAGIAAGLRAAADSGVEPIGAAIGDARPVEGYVAAAVLHDGEAGRSRCASPMALGALPRQPSRAQKRCQ